MDATTLYLQIEEKRNLGNFESQSITIGISKLPITATEAEIAEVLETADRGLSLMSERLGQRWMEKKFGVKSVDLEAFRKPEAASDPVYSFGPVAASGNPDPKATSHSVSPAPSAACSAVCAPAAAEDLASAGAKPFPTIPCEADVKTGVVVFGVELPFPAEDDWDRKITYENESGGQGGQLLALNAGLGAMACKGKDRHRACELIVDAWHEAQSAPVPPRVVPSLYDLSFAEARLCLDWIQRAQADDVLALFRAMDVAKGQPALMEQPK